MKRKQPQMKTSHKTEEEKFDTALIPDIVYSMLPDLLRDACMEFTVKRERDIFFLGSLSLISGCLPNVSGIYDKRKVFCPIYTMIIAPPASGKGVLNHSLKYVEKILADLNSKHKDAMDKYKSLQLVKPETAENPISIKEPKPTKRRLIIAANSSSAAFMKGLKSAQGQGIMFETEADSLSNTLKNDWGNYSDILRKAFHHEPVTSMRVDEDSDVEIQEPKLAVILSGTFDQVGAMGLDSPKNGLQSRFLFYIFDNLPRFKNVSPDKNVKPDNFGNLSDDLLRIHTYLQLNEHSVVLNDTQWKYFQQWFEKQMASIVPQHNGYAAALISRLGLNSFRIIMILSTLRSFDNGLPTSPITCSEKDYKIAYFVMSTLISHSIAMFSLGQGNSRDEELGKYMEFYKLLPDGVEFTRQEALQFANGIFPERTVDRRLQKLLKNGHLTSLICGVYHKPVRK